MCRTLFCIRVRLFVSTGSRDTWQGTPATFIPGQRYKLGFISEVMRLTFVRLVTGFILVDLGLDSKNRLQGKPL